MIISIDFYDQAPHKKKINAAQEAQEKPLVSRILMHMYTLCELKAVTADSSRSGQLRTFAPIATAHPYCTRYSLGTCVLHAYCQSSAYTEWEIQQNTMVCDMLYIQNELGDPQVFYLFEVT